MAQEYNLAYYAVFDGYILNEVPEHMAQESYINSIVDS